MGVLIKNEFYKLKREWFMIILDDPFSGLDKGECEHLLSVLTYLHEMNHTTLLISGQDYTLLSRLASQYGVMADGKLLCELTAGELKGSQSIRTIAKSTVRTEYSMSTAGRISSIL